MVSNVTSLTGNGLKDWLVQRVTAVYFAAYTLFLMIYLLCQPQLTYAQWSQLFSCALFQTATIVALLSYVLHAWIGIWTVTTDYLKHTFTRLIVQMLVALWLLGQFIWGFMVIWG